MWFFVVMEAGFWVAVGVAAVLFVVAVFTDSI